MTSFVSPSAMTLALMASALKSSFACTSFLIGPESTADGVPIVAQSDDGEGAGDPRLVYVPPMDWPPGSLRPVVDYGDFPRYVGKERCVPAYYPSALLPNATHNLLGHIQQVNHTYGYYEGDYAISNEHGLSFGESTCSARTYAKPLSQGGPALLTMNELSRLAAERATTARAAVEVMGTLASKHGFVGTGPIIGGESILVSDPVEGWIFHVLAESNETGGASAPPPQAAQPAFRGLI